MKLKFSDNFVIYTLIDLKTNRIITYVLLKTRMVQGDLEEKSIKKTLALDHQVFAHLTIRNVSVN